jgi:hypothetical protein
MAVDPITGINTICSNKLISIPRIFISFITEQLQLEFTKTSIPYLRKKALKRSPKHSRHKNTRKIPVTGYVAMLASMLGLVPMDSIK